MPGKILAEHSRILASRQAYDEKLAPIFLVLGSKMTAPDGEVTTSSEQFAKQMVDQYEIPQSEVMPVIGPDNTLGSIEAAVQYFKDHPDLIKNRRIWIVSNRFHLGRSMLFFRERPFFKDSGIQLIPLPVERLLLERSPLYERWIQRVRNLPEMSERLKMEKQGIVDFKSGTYKPISD